MKKTIIILSGLFLFTACVAPRDFRELKQQVNSMQEENTKSIQDTREQIEDLSSDLSQLQEKTKNMVNSNTNSVRNRQADLWSDLREQREKLAKIEGDQDLIKDKVKNLRNQTGNNTQTLKTIRKKQEKMDKQLSLISSQLNIQTPSGDTNRTEKKQDKSPDEKDTEIQPEPLYNKALDKFNSREYEEAQSLWAEFIDNFPEHELVPNAYFWQGEGLFQSQNYSDAILKYQKVVEDYKDSNKYPAALLKQGIAFYRKDKPKPGKILLQDLIKNFPDTSEAKRAKKFLQNH
ncbi:MAG: tol-pal system protein YbgF [Thermodesulfobacteriota bacterium]